MPNVQQTKTSKRKQLLLFGADMNPFDDTNTNKQNEWGIAQLFCGACASNGESLHECFTRVSPKAIYVV